MKKSSQSVCSVSVRYDPEHDELCRQMAAQLGAPLVKTGEADDALFRLEWAAGARRHAWVLRSNAHATAPLRIDFDLPRQSARVGGTDLLLKAVGARAATVVDATAGWGTDAAHLARRGIAVTAVEMNPVVAALLTHAHAASEDQLLKASLTIIHGDSIAYLRAMKNSPDVVYLDPMYPSSTKSAAAKKPLMLLRMVVGAPAISAPLFEQAMACATQRVVVKRPRRAPPIQPGRVGEVGGKLVRFDIYQPHPPPESR